MPENTKLENAVGNMIMIGTLFVMLFLFAFPIGFVFTFIIFKENVYEISLNIALFTCLFTTVLVLFFDKRLLEAS